MMPASIILSGRLPTEHCCFQPSAPRFHPKTINKSCSICRRLSNFTTHCPPVALQTLSEICFMSPNYFCHYFKQEIGKTPISFINEYRIEKACEMLSESEAPISNIALSVGFDNFSYFIRKFREYKGVAPNKYRSLCLK